MSKVEEISFGQILYMEDNGTETFFAIQVVDNFGLCRSFLWGDSSNYTSEREEIAIEKFLELGDVVYGKD